MRAYVGVPLVSPEGMALGTLCAIDHVARDMTAAQIEALGRLDRQVAAQLELRRRVKEARAARAEGDKFFEHSLDLLCVARPDGFFERINPAFTSTLGYSQQELLAVPFLDLCTPETWPPPAMRWAGSLAAQV